MITGIRGGQVVRGDDHEGARRVIRHNPKTRLARVVGIREDGRLVREGETVQGNWRPIGGRATEPAINERAASKRDEGQLRNDLQSMLTVADQRLYGSSKPGGGPDPRDEDEADNAQLEARARYYRRLIDDNSTVESGGPADVVRQRLRRDIEQARRAYGRLAAPAVPVWAKREEACEEFGIGSATTTARRLDGAAGEAWLDDDGAVDDWIDYVDEDALPPRPAQYSPKRKFPRWRQHYDAPDISLLSLLGGSAPSRLVDGAQCRGGAVLDAHGYGWGQSLNEVWIRVPVPPGARVAHVTVDVRPRKLTVALDLRGDFFSLPFAGATCAGATRERIPFFDDVRLFDTVDVEASSAWILVRRRTCVTREATAGACQRAVATGPARCRGAPGDRCDACESATPMVDARLRRPPRHPEARLFIHGRF